MRYAMMPYRAVLETLFVSTLLLAFGCSSEEQASAPAASETIQQASPTVPETAELAAPTPKNEPNTAPEKMALESAPREWKDPAGNILAVGEFVSLMDDKVCLETPDGLGAVVPLAKLCETDSNYIITRPDADLTVEKQPENAVEKMTEQTVSASPDKADGTYDHQKVVIPFGFVSDFDDGRYGSMIGEMIVKKIQKQGTFAVPDAIDIRDLCAERGIKITPDTPLEEIHRVLRDLFGAQIAVWGSCEKVAGQEWDVYDVTIKCADFSESLEPKMLYEKVNVRTKTVSEIPHLYVAEMLDKLYGREPGGLEPLDQLAEQNWIDNPNLVQNGSFEAGTGGVPTGWEDPRRSAPSTTGQSGPMDHRGWQSEEPRHSLHLRCRRWRRLRRHVLQQAVPGRRGSQVPLPVPLSNKRSQDHRVHQVLRQNGKRIQTDGRRRAAASSHVAGRRNGIRTRVRTTPRMLSQPAEP